MTRLYYFLCILPVLLLIQSALSQPAHTTSLENPPPLYTSNNYTTTGRHAFYLQETRGRLDLDQAIESFANHRFRPTGVAVPGFGISSKGVWLKFDVDNDSQTPQSRRLTVEAAWLDIIEIYIVRDRQIVYQQKTGDAVPLSSRQGHHRLFVFEHAFAPGISEIYLRAQSHEPLVLPVSLQDTSSAALYDTYRSYGYGLLYGIISGLLLFNLLIYISIRQQRYLFYVLYLAMYLFMDVSYTGHGYLYLWRDAVAWQQWAPTLSITLYATSGILFALSFLKMRELFPSIYKYSLRICVLLLLLQAVFVVFDLKMFSTAISLIYVTFFSLFTFYFAIISFNKGHNDAIYYLIATFATLIGAATTVLAVISLLPFTLLTFHAGEIAVAFDAILLSIALAEQIRRAQNEKLQAQQLARTDILTRLNNRLAFDEISRQLWDNASRARQPLCFIMLDIDRFKEINDQYGHASGDIVLKSISSILKKLVRETDVPVRWGGEEFAIILPNTNLQQAVKLAERIRTAIENLQILADGVSIRVTASLGLAEKTTPGTLDELFSRADHHLYRAKEKGRNQVCA